MSSNKKTNVDQIEEHEEMNDEESRDGLDGVLASLGMGRWHLWAVACEVMGCMMMAINLAGSPFLAPSVPFRCRSPYEDSPNSSHFDNKCYLNEHKGTWSQMTPNSSEEAVLPDEVDVEGLGEKGGAECPYGYEYDTSVFTSTVATEWDLVCDRKALQPLFQTVVSFGSIVGNTIAGSVADIFGRRIPIRFGAVLNPIAWAMVYFAPFYWIALVGRFFLGLTCSLIVYPAFNLAIETTPPKYRSLMGMLLAVPFSLAVLALSGVAYLIREWRTLQAVASTPAFLFLPAIVMVDESPRWLMQNDRGEEAVEVLQRVAKLHKTKSPSTKDLQTLADMMLQAARKRKLRSNSLSVNGMVDIKQGILQFVKTPAMRMITLLLPTVWFMQNLCYLGILLNANNFSSDNPFIYVAMNGLVEIPAFAIGMSLTYRFGRRIVITLGFLVAGIFSMAVPFFPQDVWVLQWIIVVTAYLFTALAYQVNFIYTPELFPTTLRARGASLCSVVGNLGFIVTPFVVKFLAGSAVPPSLVFGACGLTASAIVPLFPETNNQVLCEVVQDVEDRGKVQRNLWSSCCASLRRKEPETVPKASEKTNPGFVPDSTEA